MSMEQYPVVMGADWSAPRSTSATVVALALRKATMQMQHG
jgi:hypothetical protein